MTNVERYIKLAQFVAEISPEMPVAQVLAKAADLLAMAGPQPRAKRDKLERQPRRRAPQDAV